MNLLIPTTPTKPPAVTARIAWGLLALFLLAFAVFEAVKHGGWTIALAVLGLIGPDLTFLIGMGSPTEQGQLARKAVPFYNLAHHPIPPLLLIILCYSQRAHVCG